VASVLSLYIHMTRPDIHGGLGNENFQAEFLVLLAPLCLIGFFVFEGIIGWLCLTVAVGTAAQAIFLTPSDAKWAGLIGLALFAASSRSKWVMAGTSASLLIGGLLLFESVTRVQNSVLHRLELVYGTFMMWLDRPLLGAGAGSFNYLYPSYQDAHAKLFPGRALYNVTLYAGAAHNEFMQAIAIFGLVGCAIGGLAIWTVIRNRESDPVATLSLVALSMFAGLSLVGFPLQNPSTAILAVVALGLVAKPWERAVAFDCRRFWHLVRKGDPGGTALRGGPALGEVRHATGVSRR
jgi:hypothetical protein